MLLSRNCAAVRDSGSDERAAGVKSGNSIERGHNGFAEDAISGRSVIFSRLLQKALAHHVGDKEREVRIIDVESDIAPRNGIVLLIVDGHLKTMREASVTNRAASNGD